MHTVDDTLLLAYRSWANVRATKAILILLEVILGFKVNFHKSMLVGLNVPNSLLNEVTLVMNCRSGNEPFMYLGLSIGGDARCLQIWFPLLDQIKKRLSGMKIHHLSLEGRLVL